MTSTIQPDQTTDQTAVRAAAPTASGEQLRVSRRQAFAGAGSLCLLGLGLAACSSDSSDGDGDDDAATSAAAPASSSGGSTSGGATVVALADVPVGGAVSATIGGQPALVARLKEDSVVAFSAICPHQGATVAVQGDVFHCPLHGSEFNETTGDVTKGPAAKGLSEIEVVIDGKNIVTA